MGLLGDLLGPLISLFVVIIGLIIPHSSRSYLHGLIRTRSRCQKLKAAVGERITSYDLARYFWKEHANPTTQGKFQKTAAQHNQIRERLNNWLEEGYLDQRSHGIKNRFRWFFLESDVTENGKKLDFCQGLYYQMLKMSSSVETIRP